MSDDKYVSWDKAAYTYSTNDAAAGADALTLEKLSDLMKEIRQKMDSDLMGSLLGNREWERPLRSPKPDIKVDYHDDDLWDAATFYPWRMNAGCILPFPEIPILHSQYLPRGEALAVRGFGLVLGEGPATALTAVPAKPAFSWPTWAPFAVLVLILLGLTAVIGGT